MDVKAEVPFGVRFADPETGIAVTIADLRKLVISASNVVESFAGDFPPGQEALTFVRRPN